MTTTDPIDATTDPIDATTQELRKKLLEINIWAMTLILALVLESSSSAVVFIVSTHRHVQPTVWGAVVLMALIFGILLATMVGILVLHVRYKALYKYRYVILDNVFVTVPLYVAVRFIAASIGFGETSTMPLGLNEGMFRVGVALIAASYFFLLVRDVMVLPEIGNKLSREPRIAIGAMHALGAMLFAAVAIAPSLVVYVAVMGTIGLCLFFAGMVAIPLIDKRFAPEPAPVLASGSS